MTNSIPDADCDLCPRLCAFRADNRQQYPEFFNAPVPSFGGLNAQLLVVGLAPGLKGANQTGRPFTGDYAGLILYSSLVKYGFACGEYRARADDGFKLVNCRITNAVRCVPPENKPLPQEIKSCNHFLRQEIKVMPNLRVILSLGSVSHNAVLKALGLKPSFAKFSHGAIHSVNKTPDADTPPCAAQAAPLNYSSGHALPPPTVHLLNTYHSSRYNINTGRLTQEMFDGVVSNAAGLLEG